MAVDDAYAVLTGEVLSVAAPGILANDSGSEGHKLRPTLLTLPAHGHLVLALDGSFTYAPDKLFVGVDTFTYRIDDGKLDSGVATVRIAVQAPPTIDVPALDAFGRLLMLLLLGAGGWLALRRHA